VASVPQADGSRFLKEGYAPPPEPPKS